DICREMQLDGFDEVQIRDFLVRHYGNDKRRADNRERLADDRLTFIRDIKDLLGLSRNPRMLSFIAELDDSELRAVVEASGGKISSAGLYENLIARWLESEVDRPPQLPRLKFEQLHRAVTALALSMCQTKNGVGADGLEEPAEGVLAALAPALSPQEAAHAV